MEEEAKIKSNDDSDRGDYIGGALFLTLAGLGWVIFGLSALGFVPLIALLLFLGIFALLLLGGGALRRAGRGLPPMPSSPDIDRVIARATTAEVVAIVVIVLAAALFHRAVWIMPLIALAVGLHFFRLPAPCGGPCIS